MIWHKWYRWFGDPNLTYLVTFSILYWATSPGIKKSNKLKKSAFCFHRIHAMTHFIWPIWNETTHILVQFLEIQTHGQGRWLMRGSLSFEVLKSSDLNRCIKMTFFVSQFVELKIHEFPNNCWISSANYRNKPKIIENNWFGGNRDSSDVSCWWYHHCGFSCHFIWITIWDNLTAISRRWVWWFLFMIFKPG